MQMQYRGNKNINTEKNQNHAPGIYRGIEHAGLKTKNITDKGYEKLYSCLLYTSPSPRD